MWRNLHRQINNNEYAPKSQYWQIYFKGSIQMNLAWWIYIDDCTPVGKYWWSTLTSGYSQITHQCIYIISLNDKLIMNNLPQWVNIYESTCLYQYWQIYPNVLIWTNLTQWVNIDQTTLMGWCWQKYLDRSILMNLLHRFNFNKSTQMGWYL